MMNVARSVKKIRRAQVRWTKTHVLILCDLGHLIESHKVDRNFGGSAFEAELSFRHEGDRFDRLARKCQGFGHKKDVHA